MRHYLETKLAEVELAVATVRKLNAHISAQCQNQRTKLPRIRGPREKSEKEQTTTYWSCCFYLVLLNVLMCAYVCVCARIRGPRRRQRIQKKNKPPFNRSTAAAPLLCLSHEKVTTHLPLRSGDLLENKASLTSIGRVVLINMWLWLCCTRVHNCMYACHERDERGMIKLRACISFSLRVL